MPAPRLPRIEGSCPLARTRRWAVCVALALSPWGSAVSAETGPVFESRRYEVPGRPIQAWGARLGRCAGEARNLVVVSVKGVPPGDRRVVSVFPCEAADGDSAWSIEVGRAVVAVDTGPAGDPADSLALLDGSGLEIVQPWSDARRRYDMPVGLPPRTREISRMPFLADWNGDGRPAALLPTTAGGRLVWLDDGSSRAIPLPLLAEYEPRDPEPPGYYLEMLRAEITWPILMRADDDGDGRLDLFALSRYAIWIYRAGDDGLPETPSRKLAPQPFSFDEEVRHETTDLRFFAEDLDGDGRAEILLDRTRGGIMQSQASVLVYDNPGDGATASGEPDARVEAEGGIASVEVVDLDGDGRSELVQSWLPLGPLQIIRFLVTRRAELELRVLRPDPTEPGGIRTLWSDGLPLKFDFGSGRIDGIFPDVRGDWNGDGRRDLLVPLGGNELGIRLGEGGEGAATGFGAQIAEHWLPMRAASAWVEDLDRDGLDDLLVYDPRDPEGAVYVLRNRGVLPGTPSAPALEAVAAPPDPNQPTGE